MAIVIDDNTALTLAIELSEAPNAKVRRVAQELRRVLRKPDGEARDARRDELATYLHKYWTR